MKEEDENEVLLKKKVDLFFKDKTKVHISYNKGYWKRGYITEVSSDFFMLDETLEGLFPVFFIEIKSVDKFNERSF